LQLTTVSLAYSYIEVIDERLTGEVLLDEALKMMKVSERMSVGTWIDLMSGTLAFPSSSPSSCSTSLFSPLHKFSDTDATIANSQARPGT
jgi:hypothetical protein